MQGTKRIAMSLLGAIVLSGFLTGCLTVQLTEPYDETIETELVQYQKDTAAFVARMAGESEAGTEKAKFTAPDVRAFYATQRVVLARLADRAQMLDPKGSCLPSNVFARSMRAMLNTATTQIATLNGDGGSVVLTRLESELSALGDGSGPIADGNCTFVMLKVVQANHELLAWQHEKKGVLTPANGARWFALVDDAARIAIKNELIKKNR